MGWRFSGTLAVAGATLLTAGAIAYACTPQAGITGEGSAPGTVDVPAGGTTTVHGTQAEPASDVTVTSQGQVLTQQTASSTGAISFQYTAPSQPGTYAMQMKVVTPSSQTYTSTATVNAFAAPASEPPESGGTGGGQEQPSDEQAAGEEGSGAPGEGAQGTTDATGAVSSPVAGAEVVEAAEDLPTRTEPITAAESQSKLAKSQPGAAVTAGRTKPLQSVVSVAPPAGSGPGAAVALVLALAGALFLAGGATGAYAFARLSPLPPTDELSAAVSAAIEAELQEIIAEEHARRVAVAAADPAADTNPADRESLSV